MKTFKLTYLRWFFVLVSIFCAENESHAVFGRVRGWYDHAQTWYYESYYRDVMGRLQEISLEEVKNIETFFLFSPSPGNTLVFDLNSFAPLCGTVQPSLVPKIRIPLFHRELRRMRTGAPYLVSKSFKPRYDLELELIYSITACGNMGTRYTLYEHLYDPSHAVGILEGSHFKKCQSRSYNAESSLTQPLLEQGECRDYGSFSQSVAK